MSSIIIPGRSPIAKASRGLANDGNIQPVGRVRVDTAGMQNRKRQTIYQSVRTPLRCAYLASATVVGNLGLEKEKFIGGQKTIAGKRYARTAITIDNKTLVFGTDSATLNSGHYAIITRFHLETVSASNTATIVALSPHFNSASDQGGLSVTIDPDNKINGVIRNDSLTTVLVSDNSYGAGRTLTVLLEVLAGTAAHLQVWGEDGSTVDEKNAACNGINNTRSTLYYTGRNDGTNSIYVEFMYGFGSSVGISGNKDFYYIKDNPYAFIEPENQSPFIIGTAEAPPLAFDETALVSTTATVTASEVYAPPASDETALVSTAATVTATETFSQAVYDETTLISASVALDATGEVYTPPFSNESALVSITTAVNAVETFASPAYDETALVSTLATITGEDAYTAPGDAFFESGRVAIATTVTAAETYTAPAYTETGLVSFSALVEASELYFPPGSFQTAQIVISTTLDAHETWLPPATDQQALISFTGGIVAHEIFNTPSALPDGLFAITAIQYGGLKARIVRWDN